MIRKTEDKMNAFHWPFPFKQSAQAALVTMLLTVGYEAGASSVRPPANLTGAPPQNMTCAGCHTSNGTGSLSLVLDGGIASYVPGETYPMQLVINDPGQSRFGFSMVSRVSSSPTTNTGSWTAGLHSTVYDANRHIGHSDAPFAQGSYTFNFQWTAPNEDVGDITFYASANAANGNGSNGGGDNIYTQQLRISAAQPFVTLWPNSIQVQGWKATSDGYPDTVGIGIIYDAFWPMYFTFDQSENSSGEWIYVVDQDGSLDGYWAYNVSTGYFFYAIPKIGWYYSLQAGAEGWYPFRN